MPVFAVIPAAGLSRRMGRHKLTMQLSGQPVISHLLTAMDQPGIDAVAVVCRHSDAALNDTLRELPALRHAELQTVHPPEDPPDMRYSVEAGLHCIQTRFTPPDAAWWLLVPADHPVLDGSVVTELITAASQSTADILVPVHQGRRGHPTAFRWSLAEQVSRIPQNRGLNWLVKHDSVSVEECEFSTDSILLDLDTPEDFERLTRRIDHY